MPITFAQPQWLWSGALACAVITLLMMRAERKRRAGLARFAAASPETTVARPRRWLRSCLALAGVALAFVALARPRAGFRMEPVPHQGVDVMFAVDTSKSMRASDLRPDRLTRAKLAVADLVRTLGGDRVGLIAFAGAAFVQAPMTVDRTVFLEALDALDTDVIPIGGTDIASAIRAAEQAMGSEPGHMKVLVVLSDGEDLAGSVVEAAKDAARRGLTIYTVGVGSTAGSLIEMADASGARELVRDESGNPVTSHLDEPTLRSIAQVTGGAYQPLGADGRGLEALYATAKRKLPASTAAGTARKVYTERFQIPLALALVCLLGELALGDRKRRRHARGLAVTATIGLGLFALPGAARAEPAATVPTYNDAIATYRKGDFAGADRGFEAALHTADVGLQEKAYYDLGNTRYREGQATLVKDRDATIATWKRALEAYDAALALEHGDGDAQFNRDYVVKKLAALEQQKKQDQQKKHDQQQKQDLQQKQDPHDQKGNKDQKQPQPGKQPNDQKGEGPQAKDQNSEGQQPKDQNGHQANDQKGESPQAKDQKGEGPQAKDQTGEGPQAKDQKGEGPQAKDQKGEGPQAKEQKGEGLRAKDQPGQGQQPKAADVPDAAATAPKPSAAGAPGQAHDPGAAAAAAAAADDAKHRAAGELTRGEAVQLLDSVERDLKPMAVHGRASHATQTTKTKDW